MQTRRGVVIPTHLHCAPRVVRQGCHRTPVQPQSSSRQMQQRAQKSHTHTHTHAEVTWGKLLRQRLLHKAIHVRSCRGHGKNTHAHTHTHSHTRVRTWTQKLHGQNERVGFRSCTEKKGRGHHSDMELALPIRVAKKLHGKKEFARGTMIS